jgi:uncharacterized membrane protein YfcA
MSYQMVILLSLVFLVVAAVFSMLGQGGGAFYVPVLLAASVPFYLASSTSQILIVVVSLSSMLIFAKHGMLDWKLLILVEPPTNVGSFLGGYLSAYIPTDVAEACFAAVLLVGAYFMYRPIRERSLHGHEGHWWRWNRTDVAEPYSVNMLLLIPVMVLVGFAAGMLGLGGGILKVPVLVLVGGVPMGTAVGTSSLMVGATATTGVLGHLLQGHVNFRLALPLAAGVLVGSQIGPRVGVKTDRARLKKYFALLMFAVSVWLIYGVIW